MSLALSGPLAPPPCVAFGGVGLAAGLLALVGALVVAAVLGARERRTRSSLGRLMTELGASARAGRAAGYPTSPPRGRQCHVDRLVADVASAMTDLRNDRDRLAGVLSGMNDGLLMVDQAGCIALVNPALRALLFLATDTVGKTPLEVFRHRELQELLDLAATSPENVAREIVVEGLTPRRLQVRAARLAVEHGGGVFAIFGDVTEIRRLETMRRDFVANVSHELRTPVTAIRSAAETLPMAMESDVNAAETFIEVIDRNAARLHALVEDLLDLSRIESRELRLRYEHLPLAPLVNQILDLFRDRANQRKVTLAARVPVSLPLAHVDRHALERVLTNLVDNALKYSGAGSVVTVSAYAEECWLRITVADTGAGIAAEHLPRLFERFYRVDAGRSRELGGTGLGLSIVKHLVECMQGSVSVESQVGVGTTFMFTVPVALGGEDIEAQPSAPRGDG
ncbi:MAG: PAS domain-containing protein [Polyangiaceae bacterium]|nr:PAS domain-containing protein [Polyangiaceae bacterium]